jgi:hypothetical protein
MTDLSNGAFTMKPLIVALSLLTAAAIANAQPMPLEPGVIVFTAESKFNGSGGTFAMTVVLNNRTRCNLAKTGCYLLAVEQHGRAGVEREIARAKEQYPGLFEP